MYAGGFKQVLYKEYICWIQVKIHISDQTSQRICNSVAGKECSVKGRVLLLGSLELLGEESQGLPVLLAGKPLLEARAHVRRRGIHNYQ